MSFNPKVALYSGRLSEHRLHAGRRRQRRRRGRHQRRRALRAPDIAASVLGALAFSGGVWKGNKATGAIALATPSTGTATGTPTSAPPAPARSTTPTRGPGSSATPSRRRPPATSSSTSSRPTPARRPSLRVVSGQRRPSPRDTIVTGLSEGGRGRGVARLRSESTTPSGSAPRSATRPARRRRARSCSRPGRTPAATDPTPAAATTFTKKVNWIAWNPNPAIASRRRTGCTR
jgi:hypothetical protein